MPGEVDHLHTQEKLPDPKKFDPLKQNPPNVPGIPAILEWKLDVANVQLAKLNAGLNALINLVLIVLIPGLAAALAAIIALLIAINAALGNLIWVVLAFAAIVTALAYMLGRRVVRKQENLYL
jgi:predicted RND superfamily exporter protein